MAALQGDRSTEFTAEFKLARHIYDSLRFTKNALSDAASIPRALESLARTADIVSHSTPT
jgi:hypothetical protein